MEAHKAEGRLVTTPLNSDGLRWACVTCDQTVYQRGDNWFHFRKELNLPDPIIEPSRPGVIQLCEELGITYRRVDYWIRKGYIFCENPSPGSGSVRFIEDREIEILKLMDRLVHIGFTPESAALLARRFIFEQTHTTTLPGGITITLEEPEHGSEDDLDCSTEAEDLR